MDLNSKGFKKIMAMAYGIGGAIVIVGALFKLMHWPFASLMLIIGLTTEALIFVISAFEPLPKEELDWALVYPELSGSASLSKEEKDETIEGVLTKKIDEMLLASNLDVKVINKLTKSMNNLTTAAEHIQNSSGAVANTSKYSEQINSAATHLVKINSMYATQEESMTKAQSAQMEMLKNQTNLVKSVSEKSQQLSVNMDSLSNNISSLNNVYGGMLSAMGGTKSGVKK